MVKSLSLLRNIVFAASTLAVSQMTVQADVKLPSVFGNHMVLQQGQKLPVWGWAEPGETVTVFVAGQTKETKANKKGIWQVRLNPLKASKTPVPFSVKGKNTIDYKDVLIGEVWLCSGQSNMEWTVSRSANPQEEIANGKHPLIRHIKIPHRPSGKQEKDVTPQRGGWEVASPNTVANFTAVGYYFARQLKGELDVPIGLLGANWGGTRIEPWTPPAGFKSVPALKTIAENLKDYPKKDNNGKVHHQSALALYNGMISPLKPYGIRGAIWYQGESNNGEGMLYYEKKKALVYGWRKVWKNKKLHFYYVKLAPFQYRNSNPHDLAGIWQAQLSALEIPHTGMAVTTDIGNTRDIHPKNKQEVGRRLALWALAKNYGKKDIVYSGPLFKSFNKKNQSIIVQFNHDKGLKSSNDKPLTHFELQGSDGKWVPAEAHLQESKLIVTSKTVSKPKNIRFGWNQEAEPNLVNGAGLPASPFTSEKSK